MQLDLGAAALVRAGSGFLFMLVGAAMLALGRGRRENVAVGVAALAYGAGFVGNNLLAGDPTSAVPWDVLALSYLVAAAGLGVAIASSRSAAVFGGALAIILLVMVASVTPEAVAAGNGLRREVATAFYRTTLTAAILFPLTLAYMLLLAARATRAPGARERRSAALMLGGWGSFLAFNVGALWIIWAHARLVNNLFTVALTLGLLAVVVSLLRDASVSRAPRNVAWLLLATVLAGMIDTSLSGAYVSPAVGIVRTVGAVLLAYAIFREGALGFDLALPAVRQGTLATGALALLFIVAQVAQEFLAAEYGLLMGGVVAGAFLFAAAPLQRALEGRGSARRLPIETPPREASRREEAFLDACRFALRDKRLTRAEEARLHRLADELGLAPSRAHALLVQAEAEAGVA